MWFYLENELIQGPISVSEMVLKFKAGKITKNTLVRENDEGQWVKFNETPIFFSTFGPPPAPNAAFNSDPNIQKSEGKGPQLWKLNQVILWSLVFTPIFGAICISENWKELGGSSKQKTSLYWAYIAAPIFIVIYFTGLPFVYWGWWLLWAVFSGWKQAKYIKSLVEKEIPIRLLKGRLNKAAAIFISCLVVFGLLSRIKDSNRIGIVKSSKFDEISESMTIEDVLAAYASTQIEWELSDLSEKDKSRGNYRRVDAFFSDSQQNEWDVVFLAGEEKDDIKYGSVFKGQDSIEWESFFQTLVSDQNVSAAIWEGSPSFSVSDIIVDINEMARRKVKIKGFLIAMENSGFLYQDMGSTTAIPVFMNTMNKEDKRDLIENCPQGCHVSLTGVAYNTPAGIEFHILELL